ncbi:MAG: GNAT family N-acetyltransferase [Variovorax paradoxus]|nr:MAG: GNAT family N-acetyltransferase [Variovorax paradoxus]PZQ09925.1 MAG: GNAT family N-acetyltransferase [Variovorax paradoxus]
MADDDTTLRIVADISEIDAAAWDGLLAAQADPSPFMRHAYLQAMQLSGSAVTDTGWTPRILSLWRQDQLQAACALYLKTHSYGEYVFDWAWADAYQRHGLSYYPKAVIAPPFTPVPGARLLARDAASRATLLRAAVAWCEEQELSSLHLLFGNASDMSACADAGLMLRHQVQFHWQNACAADGLPFEDFDAFLASLAQDKRKKIRQERRKVAEAGVRFRWAQGQAITAVDWDFFYRCYERTYLEHGNAPYLARSFFRSVARDMSEHWLLFTAERDGAPIACSLVALEPGLGVAYGRYWGALERVDCLHFEACYYQPLQWCIAQGYQRFEGGAQGEHKMARALMPVRTSSAHWLAHPAFAEAVERFLEREGQGVDAYLRDLAQRTPFRQADG